MYRVHGVKIFKIVNKQVRTNAVNAVRMIRGEEKLQVTIGPIKDSKTHDQRAYFHVLCGLLSDETGYTPGEIKELTKRRLYGTEFKEVLGERIEFLKSSEELDRKGYSALIEQILIIGGECGVTLPPPRYKGES